MAMSNFRQFKKTINPIISNLHEHGYRYLKLTDWLFETSGKKRLDH